MRIVIPDLCVVAMIGASGSGKSTFAKKHFLSTEVLSSDFFRGLVADDENDQSATDAAFSGLYYIAEKRLDAARLTVIDATNVQKPARERILRLAKEQNCFAVAIVLDMPEQVCAERNRARPDRNFGTHVVKNQMRDLKRSIRHLQKEGFRRVYVLKTQEDVDGAEITREKLWNDKRDDNGPFDIIGDVHGCYDELCALLVKLGYHVDDANHTATPPQGRKAVFLGDLCDRGPRNVDVLKLVMHMTRAQYALCVPGNHDTKLLRRLRGSNVKLTHGLETTVQELEREPPEFLDEVSAFIDGLISHYVLDAGRLVVAHAGLKEKYQGRGSGRVREFCLYGETTGETDEYGLPVRLAWSEEYRGRAKVVYGHTPSQTVQRLNNTVCVDTGCVFGGNLTAYRYPEDDIVQVAALRQYYVPAKPLMAEPEARGDMLDIEDVQGKRQIETSLLGRPVVVHEDSAAAALEIMSRFAADPHWLIHLPPTMSPCETSKLDGWLEHPLEAFAYYGQRGVESVICEKKHMGSRAVITVCRDAGAAQRRFGVADGSAGCIVTRTGRHFFQDMQIETVILERLRASLGASDFWADHATDWVCIDAELMPWSAKAQALLMDQYAPVGRAGRDGLAEAMEALEKADALQMQSFTVDAALSGNLDLKSVLAKYRARYEALESYTKAYRQYCWPVQSVDDYRIAPFHILATEGKVWSSVNHPAHMEAIRQYMIGDDPLFVATPYLLVEPQNEASVQRGIAWWEELTESGGEGMVVKPYDFIARRGGEVLQPAVKCRGREYLRIIYGPEYLLGDHLERLKKRSLKKKRSMALAEYALGIEALERFVRAEPLYRVHECVFAVLAMESEPVDPRL